MKVIDGFPIFHEEWIMNYGEPENQTPTWIFRGQARASWRLASSFDRFTNQIDGSAEGRLETEFKALAHLYTGERG